MIRDGGLLPGTSAHSLPRELGDNIPGRVRVGVRSAGLKGPAASDPKMRFQE